MRGCDGRGAMAWECRGLACQSILRGSGGDVGTVGSVEGSGDV